MLFAVALTSEYGNGSRNASFTLIQCFITSTEKLDIEGKKIYIDKGRILSDE